MTQERRQLGSLGEALAAELLRAQGYKIVARNVRTPLGEIDLVARQGEALVFIEVKLRRSLRFGTPGEAVTARKQQRLRRAAQYYLMKHPHKAENIRFDVIAILWQGDQPQIEIIPAAF